jgi:hypothetical protein
MLNASINDAFKVSNIMGIIGWHAGMETQEILDQLSQTHGQYTGSLGTQQSCVPQPVFDPPQSSLLLHQKLGGDCNLWEQPLHRLSMDKQCNLSPLNHWPLRQTFRGVGKAPGPSSNMN